METGTIWPILVAASLLVGILICAAQFYLAVRIIRAKTDVPIFNQLFVICLLVSGWGYLILGSLICMMCINSVFTHGQRQRLIQDRFSHLQTALCNLSSCLRLGKSRGFWYLTQTGPPSPYIFVYSGVMTMISLPLNVWILSLEDDNSHQELRKMLCSIHVVVRILIFKIN